MRSGHIIVTCLPPVPTAGLTTDDINELVEKVRQQMLQVFEKTSHETEAIAAANGTSILLPPKLS